MGNAEFIPSTVGWGFPAGLSCSVLGSAFESCKGTSLSFDFKGGVYVLFSLGMLHHDPCDLDVLGLGLESIGVLSTCTIRYLVVGWSLLKA